jgi:hypothetical protein
MFLFSLHYQSPTNLIKTAKSHLYILLTTVFEGSLKDIKPEDILSVTVLKDSAAIHLYGQKGTEGFIITYYKR